MYKITTLLMVVVFLAAPVSFGAEAEKDKLGVTLDFTYMSQWITKGKEGYGKQGALFKSIDFDFWGTGIGAAVTHQEATASGYVDKSRLNYCVYYINSLFDDKAYKMKYKINWRYKHYPKLPRYVKNSQEWRFDFSWPKILPIENLAPYYTVYYEYPAGSNYGNRDITGWLHIFGLSYELNTSILPKPLCLTADVAYNDGLGGRAMDHDWAYSTLGIATEFKIIDNLTFVPRLYHQISMDDSVCDHNITYCILSMKYKF
jgi:hypothetical protein